MGYVQHRWERLAGTLKWLGLVFVALSAYGVYSGDDWRGVTMTIGPGLICLGIWQLLEIRLDGLVRGDRGGRIRQIVSALLVAFAVIALVVAGVYGHREAREPQPVNTVTVPDDLVICDIRSQDGRILRSIAHPRDCVDR